MSNAINYRPDIDGLRAVAILGVLFYHAGLGCSGGYTGVDVFFVISGYLITKLILKDLREEKFSMLDFWERRARRILPALMVVVLGVAAIGWFLLLPADYETLGKQILALAAFSSNIKFWWETDYFAAAADEKPLLHTWSLSLEEQFYLLIPLALVLLYRIRKPAWIPGLLAAAALVSFMLSVFGSYHAPAATFFLLPTRAWELAAGSLICFLPPVSKSVPRSMITWVGAAAILLPYFFYPQGIRFPGLAALPPVAGSVLLIWSGLRSSASDRQPFVQRILASRPLVGIGAISYSLYLWHWPIFAFTKYWELEPLPPNRRLLLVGLSFALAVASWRFIETPFRQRKLGTNRYAMFAYASGAIFAVAALSGMIIHLNGIPDRFSKAALAINAAKLESRLEDSFVPPVSVEDAVAGRFPRIGKTDPAPLKLLVWGDSHARSILPALAMLGEQHDCGILAAWYPQTPPALDYAPPFQHSLGSRTPELGTAIKNYLKEQEIPNVLLVARWSGYPGFYSEAATSEVNKSVHQPDELAGALLETVKNLHEDGVHVWILFEVPNHKVMVPKALLRRVMFGTDLKPYSAATGSYARQNSAMHRITMELSKAGARFIDLAPYLMGPDSEHFLMTSNGVPLYYDTHHLTKDGARFVANGLRSIFEPEL